MSEYNKFPNLTTTADPEESSLFGIEASSYTDWKNNPPSAQPITFEMIQKFFEKISSPRPYEPPMRIVSIKEYDLIIEMDTEGKIDISGYPKVEYVEEYVNRLREV